MSASDFRRRIDIERELPRDIRLARTGIPKIYWNRKLSDVKWDATQRPFGEAVQRFVNEFQVNDWEHKKAPLLQGPPGLGKTMAVSIAGVELSDRGFLVRFVPLAEYVDMLVKRSATQKAIGASTTTYDAAAKLTKSLEDEEIVRSSSHLVIFDDVGKEHHSASGWAGSVFDLAVRERGRRGLATMITTNVSVNKWPDTYSQAMGSYVREICRVISADGPTEESDRRIFKPEH